MPKQATKIPNAMRAATRASAGMTTYSAAPPMLLPSAIRALPDIRDYDVAPITPSTR